MVTMAPMDLALAENEASKAEQCAFIRFENHRVLGRAGSRDGAGGE